MDAFDCLPIACVINEKYFCVHGGITDKLRTVHICLIYKDRVDPKDSSAVIDSSLGAILRLHLVGPNTIAYR